MPDNYQIRYEILDSCESSCTRQIRTIRPPGDALHRKQSRETISSATPMP